MNNYMKWIMKRGNKVEILRFFEPNGCYYDKDFEPQGWWVLDCNQQEYFYDINGYLDGADDDELL